MRVCIDKRDVLTESRRLQEEVKYNSFQYQVMVKAIKIVEDAPEVELDSDDLK